MLLGGFWFGDRLLAALACAYMAGLVGFSVVTLPVELGASRRALALLDATHIARADELPEIRAVLRSAALTYVAMIAQRLGLFLAMLAVGVSLFGLPW